MIFGSSNRLHRQEGRSRGAVLHFRLRSGSGLDIADGPAYDFGMTITDRIEINAKVMMGKPIIRGTRIPVELILRKLSEGATEDDLLDAYPRLTRADIQAAMLQALGPNG